MTWLIILISSTSVDGPFPYYNYCGFKVAAVWYSEGLSAYNPIHTHSASSLDCVTSVSFGVKILYMCACGSSQLCSGM